MKAPYVDEAAIEALARSVGIEIKPERRALVAQRLNEMHALAAEIESVPFRDFEPDFLFDSSWPPLYPEEEEG